MVRSLVDGRSRCGGWDKLTVTGADKLTSCVWLYVLLHLGNAQSPALLERVGDIGNLLRTALVANGLKVVLINRIDPLLICSLGSLCRSLTSPLPFPPRPPFPPSFNSTLTSPKMPVTTIKSESQYKEIVSPGSSSTSSTQGHCPSTLGASRHALWKRASPRYLSQRPRISDARSE